MPDEHRSRAQTLIEAVVARITDDLGATKVFGSPVERDGITVIPVATIRFGFGGGSGADATKHQDGEGLGGGGSATAIGHIELRDGKSRFVPAFQPERLAALLLGALVLGIRIGTRRRPQNAHRRP